MKEIIIAIVLVIVGLVLIIKGGDVFVDAASWFAEVFGIPKIIVGATVVSIATTLPEMLVSSIAAFQGQVDMALSNAVGSVTANLGIAFAASILFIPMVMERKDFMAKAFLMLTAAVTIFVFALFGTLTWYGCLILLAIFIAFFTMNIKEAVKESKLHPVEVKEKPTGKLITINIIKFILGAVGIAYGASLLVDNAELLALKAGIPEAVIGATLLAVGTSLPEIVTAITSIIKKQSSLSVGNIIGANIIDLSVILPICTLIGGGTLMIGTQSAYLDLPFCIGIISIAILPTIFTQKLQKWQGATLVSMYVAYITMMVLMAVGIF